MDRSRREFGGRRAVVVGLGRSGLAAARLLLAAGARLTATDLRPLGELDREAGALEGAGVRLVLERHPDELFDGAEVIVLSPGVSPRLPGIERARRRGVPVLSEVDLVAESVGERVVAVTGSNGKSTTTALVAAMLAAAGYDAVPCGNFGTPLSEAARDDHAARRYAVELSSFQLETTSRLRAAAGILLNIQPDHLDRHGDLASYRAAKWRIAELRASGAPLVLAVDDPEVARLGETARDPVLRVTIAATAGSSGHLAGDRLVLRFGGGEETLLESGELRLPGRHNRINVLCAAVACRALGVDASALAEAARAFQPLPHRLQHVALVDGVRFVDDSKATNVDSSIEAIRALSEGVGPREGGLLVVLLGGRDKGSDFAPLAAALAAAGGRAVTFGEAGPALADALERATPGASVLAARCDTLEEATRTAFRAAGAGGVVLLSPACASFDAFSGFAARGDAFTALARRIAAEIRR